MRQFVLFLFGLSLVALSCQDEKPKAIDTPTSGQITVSCDESLRPIAEAEKEVFESLYPNAKINLVFTSEQAAIDLVLKDSARMAFVTRKMNIDEESQLKEQKISRSRSIKIAYDAIAFILNKSNQDTLFQVAQIKQILNGTYSNWSQINPKHNGAIQVVFDNPASGAIRLLKDSLGLNSNLSKQCFAVNSNKDVIDYVEKNPHAIGIIGISWISDPDDSLVRYFYKQVKVADIVPTQIKYESITWKPIQANIHLRQYPFWREVFLVSREAKSGLGTGFASFISGDQGQRIILKSGLVPSRAAIRTIELTQ